MRIQVMLRAMLALAATGMAAQIATGIHLQDVRFKGDTRLDGADFKKCASDLKSQVYLGTDWTDYFVGTVETKCLLDKGYFKSSVTASTQQLPDRNSTHQFAVTFDIDAGPGYRLGRITFKANHAISDPKALRDLFPLKDGSILDRMAIAKGLENLHYAYGELGYINFTPVPSTTFDDEMELAFLEIDMDEGKKFYVSSIGIVGAEPKVLNDLPLTKGEVYNVRLVNLFLRKHLPGVDVNDPRIQLRSLDERNGRVALTFDFRSRTE
jgi:outer membrane translocation and assembly module TamA